MEQPLTPEQAQELFDQLAARAEEFCFEWLHAGCECRAQLMIEHLQAMGVVPGRAWAVSVGRELRFPQAGRPGHFYRWGNHVAPTVPVVGPGHGVLVIDPSLSPPGPLTLEDWASTLRATAIEVSRTGLSQAEILNRQACRALGGEDLDAMVFALPLGEPPIPDVGGTGFRLGQDPREGAAAFARRELQGIREASHRRRGRR